MLVLIKKRAFLILHVITLQSTIDCFTKAFIEDTSPFLLCKVVVKWPKLTTDLFMS